MRCAGRAGAEYYMWNSDFDPGRDDMVLDEIDGDLDSNKPDEKIKPETNTGKGHRRKGRVTAGGRVSDFFFGLKDRAADHNRMLIPVALVLVSMAVCALALAGYRSRKDAAAESESKAAAAETVQEQVPALEKNAHADVNALMRTYFDALADGDISTVSAVTSGLDATEQVQITELANYIDSYPAIDVYTKPGKEDGSYICFVVTQVRFKDRDELIPGMQTIYVCTNAQGSLYINEDESDQDTVSYIRKISQQDDVVDLNNRVQEEYNALLASDSDLKQYITDTYHAIQVAVAEALGDAKGSSEASTSSTSSAVAEESGGESQDQSQEVSALRATDVINVRKSDSEDADIIGQTEKDQSYPLLEKKENGWSKISFDGQTGYVRTEYFTEIAESGESETDSSENASSGSASDAEASGEENTDDSASAGSSSGSSSAGTSASSTAGESSSSSSSASAKATQRAKTNDTVSIRSEASADSKRVGTVWGGFEVTVLEKGDTWSKVEFNGTTGYIKNEFLNF